MKKIFLTSIMFLSLFFSCDILEEEPKTVLPPDGYYNTKTGIETLVNACYARLRSFSASTTNLLQLTEQGTDIFEAGVDGDEGMDNNGWVAGLAYKGAKASQPGSWGVYANYYDMPGMTYLDNTNDGYNGVMNDWKYAKFGNDEVTDGFKGYEVGANVALAKNIVAAVKYYDLESREGDLDDQAIWSEVVFTF